MVRAYQHLINIRVELNGKATLSDLPNMKNIQVNAFVGLYLAIRDVERFYTLYLSTNDYIRLANLLNEMGIFDFAQHFAERANVKVSGKNCPQAMSYSEFQLTYASNHIIRDVGSKRDSRVGFIPDEWQIKMLDAVDSHQSLLVSAPTSSGKTFVSYYCMEKILKENSSSKNSSKKGRIVFVVPTKALVNQTSGDIYKRYGLKFAVFTRDQKDDNYETAQILITVPQMLEILLLSAASQGWVNSIKYAIIDEVHNIGERNDGPIWERILALLPSPVICLSATIGNFEDFGDWLEAVCAKKNQKLCRIKQNYRFNDIELFVSQVNPNLMPTSKLQLGSALKHSSPSNVVRVHPFALFATDVGWKKLVAGMQASLNTIDLGVSDCLFLYQSMMKYCLDDKKSLSKSLSRLNPSKFFTGTIFKSQVMNWATELKSAVASWFSTFPSVVHELFSAMLANYKKLTTVEETTPKSENGSSSYDVSSFLNLLVDLDYSEKLPAIVFILNRQVCESLVKSTLLELERLEQEADNTVRMSRSEEKQLKKSLEQIRKDLERCNESDYDTISNLEAEQARLLELLAPPAINRKYSFAGLKRNPDSEFFLARLTSPDSGWLTDDSKILLLRALYRGLAVHHSGLDKIYRDTVEALFRMGFIRVVVATGTLSAGINMPCRTTVLYGDSIFLNPMEFKQMSGRSGRRGYDSVGNVVFLDVPWDRIAYFVCSPLPSIQGGRPFGSSLVLRGATLMAQAKPQFLPGIASRFSILLLNPLQKLDSSVNSGDNMVDAFLCSLAFLESKLLLDSSYKPILGSPSTLVERIFYHEPANFTLAGLLQSGVLQEIVSEAATVDDGSLLILKVLAHFFNCHRLPQGWEAITETLSGQRRNILLGPLDSRVNEFLKLEDERTMSLYLSLLARRANEVPVLPFSGFQNPKWISEGKDKRHIPFKICSHFIAIRGIGDNFSNLQELIDFSGRDPRLLPAVGNLENINSYAVDFFKHGSLRTMTKEYFIREADAFGLLKDWTLLLKSLSMCCNKEEDSMFSRSVSRLAEKFEHQFNRTGGRVMII